MKKYAFSIILCLLISGCSAPENKNDQLLQSIKQKVQPTLQADTKGLKKSSAERYKSRFNALVLGINSGSLNKNREVAQWVCNRIDWEEYGKEKNIRVESMYDSIRLKHSCYAGMTLAFIVDDHLKVHRTDAETQLYNILLEIGLTQGELDYLLTGEQDLGPLHFGTVEDTYNYALREKTEIFNNHSKS